jgi:tetratricopeptide (TPR) repeat protein
MVKRISELRRRLEQDPADMSAAVELADLYQRAGMWEQAADYYEQALEIEREHPQLLVNLGLCYRGLERFDAALESFAEANRLDPANWQSLFNTVVVAALDLRRFEVAFGAMDALDEMNGAPGGPDANQLRELRQWLVDAQSAAEREG